MNTISPPVSPMVSSICPNKRRRPITGAITTGSAWLRLTFIEEDSDSDSTKNKKKNGRKTVVKKSSTFTKFDKKSMAKLNKFLQSSKAVLVSPSRPTSPVSNDVTSPAPITVEIKPLQRSYQDCPPVAVAVAVSKSMMTGGIWPHRVSNVEKSKSTTIGRPYSPTSSILRPRSVTMDVV